MPDPNEEEQLYAQVSTELTRGDLDEGLWAKCFADCDGEENAAKALYLKRRVERLSKDNTIVEDQMPEEPLPPLLHEPKEDKSLPNGLILIGVFLGSTISLACIDVKFGTHSDSEYGEFSVLSPWVLGWAAGGSIINLFFGWLCNFLRINMLESGKNETFSWVCFFGALAPFASFSAGVAGDFMNKDIGWIDAPVLASVSFHILSIGLGVYLICSISSYLDSTGSSVWKWLKEN